MKVNQKIKELVKKHHNAAQKISELQKEIQNLEIAKESLRGELETELWDLNIDDSYFGSGVFNTTCAINGTDVVSILSFREDRISSIIHYPILESSED